jgi:hypothetical protein
MKFAVQVLLGFVAATTVSSKQLPTNEFVQSSVVKAEAA